jgi:L-histidine N-alpha-methyltransferase
MQMAQAEKYPDEYLDARAELEVSALTGVLGGAYPEQLCDIGVSNGAHTAQFLRLCAELGRAPRSYLGIDVSEILLCGGRDRISTLLPARNDFACCDIEDGPVHAIARWRGASENPVLLCLFGGTLGNLEDEQTVLTNLKMSCRPGDILSVGVHVRQNGRKDQLIAAYSSPITCDVVREPFRAAGLADDDFEIVTEYINHAVVQSVLLKKHFAAGGRRLARGEYIRCFVSRRYDATSLRALMLSAGWRPLDHCLNAEGYLVVVAERLG